MLSSSSMKWSRRMNFILFSLLEVSLAFHSKLDFTKTPSFLLKTSLRASTVSSLLEEYSSDISALKQLANDESHNDVFYLRYCLGYDNISDAKSALKENLEWRSSGEGKIICDSASNAYQQASSSSGWDNTPVRDNAPNADIINNYITPSQILTTTSSQNDLVYCIRSGKIDDTALMSQISQEEMVKFFLYCKEIHNLVANDRSLELDKLVRVITCNDLTGVKLVGGDKTFRNALSAASTKANDLYPTLGGPTLLLNLPPLLGALVKLFTPLFPSAVRKRLKFEKGPLDKDDVKELLELNSVSAVRTKFLGQLDELVYKGGDW